MTVLSISLIIAMHPAMQKQSFTNHHPPILFNKVEFAMIFWIEVTQMTARLDQLLKLGLLRDEIRL